MSDRHHHEHAPTDDGHHHHGHAAEDDEHAPTDNGHHHQHAAEDDGHRHAERAHAHDQHRHAEPAHAHDQHRHAEPAHAHDRYRHAEPAHAHDRYLHGDTHPHGHPHAHPSSGGLRHRLGHLLTPHSHETADKVDPALEASARGMRALWVSLAVLGGTALLQAVVVAVSGSVALLGDTVHNAADALTAVPLGIAFVLGRRAANRRYTYGYGRSEDLAGIAIVLTITASAAFAAWTAVERLLDPRPVAHLPAVAAAALLGFAGNEWVARYRIRVGRDIGSAALVADGLHARTDGFASLAVLLGAGGAALGLRLADPLVGLAITAAIALVLRDAAREVFRRVMDAVDPELVDRAERTLREVPGVRAVGELRLRWIGHRLRAEVAVVVDGEATVRQAHAVAVAAEHALLHAVPRLTAALVHADPAPAPGERDPHLALAHHAPGRTG
ncbi:cation diffusion facilitator family transporter [Streptomyces sp. NPDC001068]|uniref:cation diffusion facilitator family transporter n=1 Tax=Streptomyces sp. NPDC001068 TaxID=3364544 RepID=UPI00368BA2B9